MSDEKEVDIETLKYLRTGHIDQERQCDRLALFARSLIASAKELPQRWRWTSQEVFLEKYGDLGTFVWANASSYQMLMVNGVHAFRIWTDSPNSVLVDISDQLADVLKSKYEILDVPKSTYRKTKPFTKRLKIESESDVKLLVVVATVVHYLRK